MYTCTAKGKYLIQQTVRVTCDRSITLTSNNSVHFNTDSGKRKIENFYHIFRKFLHVALKLERKKYLILDLGRGPKFGVGKGKNDISLVLSYAEIIWL